MADMDIIAIILVGMLWIFIVMLLVCLYEFVLGAIKMNNIFQGTVNWV